MPHAGRSTIMRGRATDWDPQMSHSFFRSFATLAFATAVALATSLASADDGALSSAQKSEIEKLVHDYIMDNPQVILDAVRQYQEKQEAARQEARDKRIVELRDALEHAKTSPVGGNPDGDVTIVEFFDYRCPYCKKAHDIVSKVIEADGKVRLVYKEFPILGPDSVVAARAALAAFLVEPGKYEAFYDALMRSKGPLPEARVFEIAKTVGLEADALRKAMDDPAIGQEIGHNRALAQELEITGTPAFVIGGKLYPGMLEADNLILAIAAAREKG